MKKNFLKKLLLRALALAFLASLLTACTAFKSEEDEPLNFTVIATQGANMPVTNFTGIEDELLSIAETDDGSTFSLIISDGEPFVAASLSSDDFAGKNASHRIKEVKEVIETLNAISAQTEETNLVSAIDMAGRQLHSVSNSGTLYIYHSGLSTAGVLQMQETNDLTALDTDAIVEQLSGQFDLTGIDVVWYYFADTCGEQIELSKNEEAILKQFWSTLLTENGATSITFKEDLPKASEHESAPYISTVQTHATTLTTPVTLDESILFEPDSAVVQDESAAKQALASIAEELKKSGTNILIAGSSVQTPEATPESAKKFTEHRANSVAALLVDLGVEQDQIQIIGLGYSDTPLRSEFDSENRVVYILNAESELATQLLAKEYKEK